MNNYAKLIFIVMIFGTMLVSGCAQEVVEEEPEQTPFVPTPQEKPEPVEEKMTISLTVNDNSITPAKIVASSGMTVIEVMNKRKVYEELLIESDDNMYEFGEGLPAGETTSLEFDLAPGKYKVYSPIPGREVLGLVAELVVE